MVSNAYFRATYKGYIRDETTITQHKYLNDTLVIMREENFDWRNNDRQNLKVSYDTLIYNHNQLLRCEIDQLSKQKIFYEYNDKKQMVSKTFTRSASGALIGKTTFIYKEGRLIREEIRSPTECRSLDYISNANGLLETYKIGPLNSIIYKYDF